jgi:cardiolipin synthase A/B
MRTLPRPRCNSAKFQLSLDLGKMRGPWRRLPIAVLLAALLLLPPKVFGLPSVQDADFSRVPFTTSSFSGKATLLSSLCVGCQTIHSNVLSQVRLGAGVRSERGIELSRPELPSGSMPALTKVKYKSAKPKAGHDESEIAEAMRQYGALRWFAVISMLAIISWILIDLFGPIPRYQLSQRPSGDLTSPEFQRELEALAGSKLDPHTHVESLPNGTNFYEAELAAISAAQKSIDWEAYIFSKGEIAKRIVDALTERARAGVRVNLVMDAVGSLSTPKKFFDELRLAGGRVEWYHPVRWYNWPRANNRTHRELIIIDGKVGFLGGAGVADHWWHGAKIDPPWRDTMFRVTGEAVRSLQSTFVENWLESSGQILIGAEYFDAESNSDGATAMVVDSSPSQGGSTRARIVYQTLIASAEKSLKITTPYFLPDDSLRKELVRAITERHVRVQILVPGKHSDHSMTRSSSRGRYGDLLKAGAEIYEYEPAMIHAKIMIVDDLWCVVGSTNLDQRSFGWNDEVNLAVLDPALAARLGTNFQDDLAQAHRETLEEWEHRPVWERSMEWLGWLIAREQ